MSLFKQKLRNGEHAVGTMITAFTNPDIINILQVCGVEYAIIDCEHGAIDYSEVAGLVGRAKAVDFPLVVRIPEVKREVVLKYMEMGAVGLLLPNTETVEQAKALVEYSKYAPMGNRGVSLLRPHTGYKKIPSATQYMKESNEETILMIQVESPICVENLDDILKVEGIDCAFVGPNDLSQSLGIMGQYDHPYFVDAIDKIIKTSQENNKFCGIHLMASPEALQVYRSKGMTMNLWSNEVVMMMETARRGMEFLITK
jgi:2-dehydro-3-deoxyglucarate aldolase/4-hydroxy-2-oxoheptanedioate aldolase